MSDDTFGYDEDDDNDEDDEDDEDGDDFSTSVMYWNLKFLHMTDFVLHLYIGDIGDKYQVCTTDTNWLLSAINNFFI